MAYAPLCLALPAVHVVRAAFDKSNHGMILGTIPSGAKILGAVVNIGTAFDAGATVAVGWAASTAAILASATVAPTATGDKAGALFPKLTADQDVILTLGATTYAAGAGEVWIWYAPPAGVT